jgi:Zn-dependent M16 (insulinase) family peptidase
MPTKLNPIFLQVGARYHGFRVIKSLEIPELQCHLVELKHEESGAEVMHIANDDPENLFCLSFRTLPASSNGVAHILEHQVLCGSKKYPARDPFISMNRRSLNTFLNALTGADFTCYPAATQVEQDFYNLLDVYLDAVFHPLLLREGFAQEGHRLEFATIDDPTSPLEYKGIVYNEMKGALASPSSRLSEAMSQALFPESPYGFNSGGDPKEIPYLSYEELVAFHKKYYHPSKCLFFFYGNLPLEKHLDFIQEQTLKGVQETGALAPVPRQHRFTKKVTQSLFYPIEGEEEADDYISFGWLTCSVLDEITVLGLTILEIILMNTDASYLKHAFLQSGLCKQATSYLDTENVDVPFVITLKGCKAEDADVLENVLFSTLKKVIEKPIPEKQIESALHQLEHERLEIGADAGPFGLSLFGRSALLKQHGGKAEDGLRIHSLFQELRNSLLENPNFLKDLIINHFMNNQHFARITMRPSKELAVEEAKQERARLDRIRKTLSPQDIEQIIKMSVRLKEFQEKDDSHEIELLPKITLKDVSRKAREFVLKNEQIGNAHIFHHPAFTNHILYTSLVFPVPQVPAEDLWLARLFTILLPQIGCGNRNYQENLEFIQEHTGGVGCGFAFNPQAYNAHDFLPTLHMKGKALYRKADRLFQLLVEMTQTADLSDIKRIKELIHKHYTNLHASLTPNALRYALTLSASGFDAMNALSNEWYGLNYYVKIRELSHHIDTSFEPVLQKLKKMKELLLGNEGLECIITCDETMYNTCAETGFGGIVDIPVRPFTHWKNMVNVTPVENQARIISSQVAFTAKTFPGVSFENPHAPYLSLASHLFQNTTLHRKIREQGGAYGGGASNNPSGGLFSFFSFRDPNIATTLVAFQEAVSKILRGDFQERDIEEAKLEVLQALDTPIPASSRGEVAYSFWKEGKTYAIRQAFREKILDATSLDIQRAVEQEIAPNFNKGVTVTFSGKELIERENKKLHELELPELKIEKI